MDAKRKTVFPYRPAPPKYHRKTFLYRESRTILARESLFFCCRRSKGLLFIRFWVQIVSEWAAEGRAPSCRRCRCTRRTATTASRRRRRRTAITAAAASAAAAVWRRRRRGFRRAAPSPIVPPARPSRASAIRAKSSSAACRPTSTKVFFFFFFSFWPFSTDFRYGVGQCRLSTSLPLSGVAENLNRNLIDYNKVCLSSFHQTLFSKS